MSPEQIRRQPYGFKVDIWAIGCVIYTLCHLEAPFLGDNFLTLGHSITTLNPKPLPAKYSPSLQGLVNIMLEKDQNIRPKIKEIIKMIPSSIRARYKKPCNSIINEIKEKEKNPKVEILPLISPYKRTSQYIIKEGFQTLIIPERKKHIKDIPDLPRAYSRNLDKSRSKTTVHDLYKV